MYKLSVRAYGFAKADRIIKGKTRYAVFDDIFYGVHINVSHHIDDRGMITDMIYNHLNGAADGRD